MQVRPNRTKQLKLAFVAALFLGATTFGSAHADGWAVGTGGLVMKSTDGGATWTSTNPNGAILNATFFLDDATGWVVGTGGLVMKTTNGGSSWTQSFPTGAALNDVFFVNTNLGFAVGTTGTILKTTNGGSSWTTSTPTATTLDAVYFIDQNTGWAVGGGGVVLKTTNGGTNWSQTNPTGAALRDVFFISSTTGWAVGTTGTTLRTTNGGTTWTATNPTAGTLNGVRFVSTSVGWAVGGAGVILKSINGGANWSSQQPVAQDLNSVYFIDSNTGWAVGSGGAVLKTTNAGGAWTSTFPTGAVLNDVHFASVPAPISVTVQTSPSGRSFVVDGTSYTTAQTFSWFAGQSHSIGTTSPQSGGTGTQYVWTTWSDGGTISHTIAPSASGTYTANFQTQYQLTMQAGAGGTVSPASGFRNAGAGVSIGATPSGGNIFTGWVGTGPGSYTGTSNPATITMNGPITETGSFAATVSVVVRTNPTGRTFGVDGTSFSTQQTFVWQSGSSHTISTSSPQNGSSGTRYVWTQWSDGGALSHMIAPTTSSTYTAQFTTQYELSMTAGSGGTVSPPTGWRDAASTVTITATPSPGFTFQTWAGTGNGSFSGSSNPTTVTMNAPIQQVASFANSTLLRVPLDFASIGTALAVANSGDTVQIDCGTYIEHTLVVPSGVVIRSSTGLANCVTIDPGEEGVGVFIVDGNSATTLDGLTITNARAFGGAALRGNGSPTVTDCAFTNNRTLGFAAGGAVDLSGTPHFENCEFTNNQASSGGAVDCSGGSFVDCVFASNTAGDLDGGAINGTVDLLERCTFEYNFAFLNGGAVYACADTLRDCLFRNNGVASAHGTGGAVSLQCNSYVANCTFYWNSVAPASPDAGGAALFISSGSSTITRTIIANSHTSGEVPDVGVVACGGSSSISVTCTNIYGTVGSGDWVGCISGLNGSNGNISADPLFCDADSGDFALASASPSLNAACGRQGAFGLGCISTNVGPETFPSEVLLHQNVPNPFNPSTSISFDVPAAGAELRVAIYDVLGRVVRTLVNERVDAGTHAVRWDGTDDRGQRVSSGVYFCRLSSTHVHQSRKLLLLK